MGKEYEAPKVTVVDFEEDIITSSTEAIETYEDCWG